MDVYTDVCITAHIHTYTCAHINTHVCAHTNVYTSEHGMRSNTFFFCQGIHDEGFNFYGLKVLKILLFLPTHKISTQLPERYLFVFPVPALGFLFLLFSPTEGQQLSVSKV